MYGSRESSFLNSHCCRQSLFSEPTEQKIDITKHKSFSKKTKSRKEAEDLLQEYGGSCHMTSQWVVDGKEYNVLSVCQKKNGKLDSRHFRLEISNRKCKLFGKDTKKFDGISELLSYYQRNPLTDGVDSIGDQLEFDSNDCVIHKTCM